MRAKMTKKEHRNLYWTGWAIFICVGMLLLYSVITGFRFTDYQLPCIFNRLTGLYCPGCGGTRAVLALLHGRLLQSIAYHPIVAYAAGVYFWYMLTHTIEILSKDRYAVGMKYRDIYLYIGLGIMLLHFILRNALLL